MHSLKKKRWFDIRTFCLLCGLLAMWAGGLAARRLMVQTQHRETGAVLPFTLESALHFRRIRMIYDGEGLEPVDRAIEYPHGVESAKIYTLGSEWLYARLARAMPRSISLEDRLRWIEAGWFSLGIPLLVLWIRWWRGSWLGGFCAAAFYAVGLSSVTRSSGIELSRENFALPWLILHLALEALGRRETPSRRAAAALVGSSAALAISLISWDLIQYYVLLWAVAGAARVLCGGLRLDRFDGRLWCSHTAGLVLVGLLNPYHAAHGWLFSPIMLLVYGVTASLLLEAWRRTATWRWPLVRRGLVLLLPLLAGRLLPEAYRQSYSHFGNLLWAKIRFLNQKPLDPALLDYESRIMWVPALHSANLELTFQLFPAMLALSILGGFALSAHYRRRLDATISQLLFYFGISLAAYWFFVRFHVFLALFSTALIGVWAAWAQREAAAWSRWLAATLLGLGLAMEAGGLLRAPEKWGRTDVYYRELQELIEWAQEHIYPEAVVASFGTSASLLAYAGCPIVLHPKFETPEIRERVRDYGEYLFKGTEREFRDWADRHGAGYYVHGLGEFAVGVPVQYQMRYMVDAVHPHPDAPALLFEQEPERLEYFRLLWENRKYRVFRIQTRADEAEAESLVMMAQQAFERGALSAAFDTALEALRLDRNNQRAADIVGRVSALWERGVTYDATE